MLQADPDAGMHKSKGIFMVGGGANYKHKHISVPSAKLLGNTSLCSLSTQGIMDGIICTVE